jgi:hypothetical protein
VLGSRVKILFRQAGTFRRMAHAVVIILQKEYRLFPRLKGFTQPKCNIFHHVILCLSCIRRTSLHAGMTQDTFVYVNRGAAFRIDCPNRAKISTESTLQTIAVDIH